MKCCSDDLLNECRSFLEGEFFTAFVDESRREIILLLMEHGRLTVNGAATYMSINQSNVSRHLTLLKRAGLAISERDGRETYYQLNYENITKRLLGLAGIVQQCC